LGKGNKFRKVYSDPTVCKSITDYLRERGGLSELDGEDFLFLSQSGASMGQPLAPGGLFQIVARLGRRAGIRSVPCSPHVLRHSFATETLRNERGAFLVQQALGHTTMSMTRRYISLSEADQRVQHQRHHWWPH